MSEAERTFLDIVSHIIHRNPSPSAPIEQMAAAAQGKGFGSFTVSQEVEAVYSLLSRRPTLAIDIGGNVGEYSSELRTRDPDLEIHIFEPSGTNISELRERFNTQGGVHIVPKALASERGLATLFSDKTGSGLASLTNRRLNHFGIEFGFSETIEKLRFDEYWHDVLKKRAIDIVKIDAEGHELEILRGFGDAIFSTNLIQFEFGGANIDTRTYFQDFWYYFKDAKFRLYRITPIGAKKIERYSESDEYFSTTNYIAVRIQVD